MVKNMESLGAPCQRHEVNGYAYWHGSGRLTVCDSSNAHHQTSRVLSRLPEDTDVQDVIARNGTGDPGNLRAAGSESGRQRSAKTNRSVTRGQRCI